MVCSSHDSYFLVALQRHVLPLLQIVSAIKGYHNRCGRQKNVLTFSVIDCCNLKSLTIHSHAREAEDYVERLVLDQERIEFLVGKCSLFGFC